ncbi:hypothetical protein [Gemmata sp.]|uniref:hypothetical protein n=1 Tax=Gemmata sp. TaxID=1914242 RepID=UPI003F727742
MARSQPASGEVFEPKTVIDKVDVASDTRLCLPAVFDLAGREVVWADIALEAHPRFPNNVHNNIGGVSLMLRAMTGLRKTDLGTLVDLHVRARGHAVSNVGSAETVFAVDQGDHAVRPGSHYRRLPVSVRFRRGCGRNRPSNESNKSRERPRLDLHRL